MRQTFTQMKLSVSIFKEGAYYVAYLPSLDLSTSAKTFKEVKQRVKELVEIFFEELREAGTTRTVLEELGWIKIKQRLVPPSLIAHEVHEVSVPAFA